MKTGIWIDLKEAFIVKIDDNETITTEKMVSEVEPRERIPGEGKKYTRFGDQYFDDEKSKKNRLNHQIDQYLEQVLDRIKDAEDLLIFGPSQTKIRLEKLLKNDHNFKNTHISVVNADQMTDNQKRAYVRKYYGY